MIDIHCHILPGIDDGPAVLDESVEMCHAAGDSGCEALIATPHVCHPSWWNTEPRKLQVLLERLQKKVGGFPKLHLGGEVRVGPSLLHDLENFENSGLSSLAGSSYLLLEFHRHHLTVDPLDVVMAVRDAGWYPVIAHPEFIAALTDTPPLALKLVEAGALMQITAMSLLGGFGRQTEDFVSAMLDAHLVHFVASDSHDVSRRPPGLDVAFSEISARWGKECAQALIVDNPRAILEDRPLESQSAKSAIENGSLTA